MDQWRVDVRTCDQSSKLIRSCTESDGRDTKRRAATCEHWHRGAAMKVEVTLPATENK